MIRRFDVAYVLLRLKRPQHLRVLQRFPGLVVPWLQLFEQAGVSVMPCILGAEVFDPGRQLVLPCRVVARLEWPSEAILGKEFLHRLRVV